MQFRLGVPKKDDVTAASQPPYIGNENDPSFAPLVMPPWIGLPGKLERRVLPARTRLFNQTGECAHAYLIESGIIRLSRQTADGSASIVGLRSNGCMLDAASVAIETPYWYTAEALTRTVVTVVPATVIRQALDRDQDLIREFNNHLIREIVSLEDQEMALRMRSVDARLHKLVSEFEQSLGEVSCATKDVTVKHGEVASLLGITRSHLSRLLRRYPATAWPTRAEANAI